MFGFELNEQEKRKALLETGEECGEARGKINAIRNLVLKSLVNINDLEASGDYTPEELAAISASI